MALPQQQNTFMDYYNHLFTDLAGMLIKNSNNIIFVSAFISWLCIAVQLCVTFRMIVFIIYLNLQLIDPRTNHWPLISSPVPGLTILAAYLYFVTSWGPRYMANRKPFRLENILIGYNLIQVAVSTYLFYEVKKHNSDL